MIIRTLQNKRPTKKRKIRMDMKVHSEVKVAGKCIAQLV